MRHIDWEKEAKHWESLLNSEINLNFVDKPLALSCLTLCRVLASGKELGDRLKVEAMAGARMASSWYTP